MIVIAAPARCPLFPAYLGARPDPREEVFELLDPIRHPASHRRGLVQPALGLGRRGVDSPEVVVHEAERCGMGVVLRLH